MEELRAREVVRSANNPTGDLAEYLFCVAFKWKQEGNFWQDFFDTYQSLPDWMKLAWLVVLPAFALGLWQCSCATAWPAGGLRR